MVIFRCYVSLPEGIFKESMMPDDSRTFSAGQVISSDWSTAGPQIHRPVCSGMSHPNRQRKVTVAIFSAFFGTQKGLLQEWFFDGAMVVEHIHIIWSRIRSLLIDDCMALCYPRLEMITIPSHARDQSVGPLGLSANPLALAHRIWPRSLPDCCDTGPQTSVKCSTLRFDFETIGDPTLENSNLEWDVFE